MKRRWHSTVLILICVLAAGIALDAAWERHVRRMRDASYLEALQSYSANLKPGMTRKDVEQSFRTRGVAFQQWGAESDLILVGKGKPDWVCSDKSEYLAFHFAPAQQGEAWKAQDADTLTRINLFFDGKCL
jgi:hypothetical protein